TNKTFRYAAELIEYPFNRSELYEGLYAINQNIARLRGYVLQNFHMSKSGVSSIKLSKDILEKFHIEPMETSNLVGALGDIEEIRALVFFIEEDDVIRVRIRSKGPMINVLAARYNGGGHPLAAGASVTSWEEADQLISDLEDLCAN